MAASSPSLQPPALAGLWTSCALALQATPVGYRLKDQGTALLVLQLQQWHSSTAACVSFWEIFRVNSRFVLKINTFPYQSKIWGLEIPWNNAYFIPEEDGTMPLICLFKPSCASYSLSLPLLCSDCHASIQRGECSSACHSWLDNERHSEGLPGHFSMSYHSPLISICSIWSQESVTK